MIIYRGGNGREKDEVQAFLVDRRSLPSKTNCFYRCKSRACANVNDTRDSAGTNMAATTAVNIDDR